MEEFFLWANESQMCRLDLSNEVSHGPIDHFAAGMADSLVSIAEQRGCSINEAFNLHPLVA